MTKPRIHPLLQEMERCDKTLDAISTAPEHSIRAMLRFLYSEGDHGLKSRIENFASAITNFPGSNDDAPTVATETKAAQTTVRSGEKRAPESPPGNEEKGKRRKGNDKEKVPESVLCDRCYKSFDPNEPRKHGECRYYRGEDPTHDRPPRWLSETLVRDFIS